MNYCQCGCGQSVKNKYVKGHNSRGRKVTKETREKMSKSIIKAKGGSKTRIPFEMRECACGCGKKFRAKRYWKDGDYRYKKFYPGHNSRMEIHKSIARESIKKAKKISLKTNRGPNHNFYNKGSYITKVRGRYWVGCRDKSVVPYARIVMENKIGRPLKKGEIVHHIDGGKTNDHPDNLMLFKNISDHIQWHWDNDMGPNKKRKSQPCECGCGETTAPGKRFISGHNSKVNHPMHNKRVK